jgi:hypothetical protein
MTDHRTLLQRALDFIEHAHIKQSLTYHGEQDQLIRDLREALLAAPAPSITAIGCRPDEHTFVSMRGKRPDDTGTCLCGQTTWAASEAPADAPPATPFSKTWSDKEQRLVPDEPPAPPAQVLTPLADRFYDAQNKAGNLEADLDDALLEACVINPREPDQWPLKDIAYDDYDSSFEFWQVTPGFQLTPEQWAACQALGFGRAWLCYTDDTERYYPGGSLQKKAGRAHQKQDRKYQAAKREIALRAEVARLQEENRWLKCFDSADLSAHLDAERAQRLAAEAEVARLQEELKRVDDELGAGGICDGAFLVGMIKGAKHRIAELEAEAQALRERLTAIAEPVVDSPIVRKWPPDETPKETP